eukprot:7411914-Pyramimonas_sp.AAC.1
MAPLKQPAEIALDSDNKKHTRSDAVVKEGELQPYPCAPKGARFLPKSDRPGRAPGQVEESHRAEEKKTQRTCHLNPEFKFADLKGS